MLNFEVASRNAIQAVLPLTIAKACFCHYAQCIWRKTQSCGLMSSYKQYDNVKKLERRAAVLPLIPIQQMENMWFTDLEENDDLSTENNQIYQLCY